MIKVNFICQYCGYQWKKVYPKGWSVYYGDADLGWLYEKAPDDISSTESVFCPCCEVSSMIGVANSNIVPLFFITPYKDIEKPCLN